MNHTTRYIMKSFLKMVTLIVAISIITFILVELSPIDAVKAYVGAESTISPEQQALIAERWGLNEPPVTRFIKWASAFVAGDLGQSIVFRRSVWDIISTSAMNSFYLMLAAWVLSGLFGVALGMWAAVYEGRLVDKVVRFAAYVLASTPTFWIGIIALLIFSVYLKWFPIGLSAPIGKMALDISWSERLHHMILPALTLSIVGISNLVLFTREKMIEVLHSDYVLFAVARGESTMNIVWKQAFRNVLLPVVTLQFASLSELFGGSVLAETVFSYAGLGSVTVAAGIKGDIPLLLGITICASSFVFIGNLIANLLYPIIDPRIKESYHGH